MTLWRAIALTLVLSMLTGAIGAFAGARYVLARMHHDPPLHQMLHQELHLTAEQARRIEGMERDYAAKRKALEAEMRAANAELAMAYQEQQAFTPKMQQAIDRFHRAMEALQRESLVHVIAMRSVLTPAQAGQFDAKVVKSLTDSGS